MSSTESRFVESKASAGRYSLPTGLHLARRHARPSTAQDKEEDCRVEPDFSKFVPFLTRKCGVEFRGRILEIGAGAAWLSAELSKQPKVVEVIATDFSPKLLKDAAPKIFKALRANGAKITRTTADCHKLDFPNNYFDFVVSSAVLHDTANVVQVLREAKRVLKPGGQFVAVREPVWPLMRIKSRKKMLEKLLATGINERFYTLAQYKEFFRQASLPLRVKRVNLSKGFKYYVNEVVNGLTHARYAFIGAKPGKR